VRGIRGQVDARAIAFRQSGGAGATRIRAHPSGRTDDAAVSAIRAVARDIDALAGALQQSGGTRTRAGHACRAGGAFHEAGAAVQSITLQVDASSRAVRVSRVARGHALSRGTHRARRAGVAALPAIARAGGKLGADASAVGGPCRTRALASSAIRVTAARQPAATTIPRVGPEVHARPRTRDGPPRALRNAGSRGAELAGGATDLATAAVEGIGREARTLAITRNPPVRAGTSPLLACSGEWTGSSASAAMIDVAGGVDTSSAAVGEPLRTRLPAAPRRTHLTRSACGSAAPAILRIDIGPRALVTAICRAAGTITHSSDTRFASLTGGGARPAMPRIGKQIHAGAVAVREPAGTRRCAGARIAYLAGPAGALAATASHRVRSEVRTRSVTVAQPRGTRAPSEGARAACSTFDTTSAAIQRLGHRRYAPAATTVVALTAGRRTLHSLDGRIRSPRIALDRDQIVARASCHDQS